MQFASWVNRRGLSKAQKATNRLRFLLGMAALQFSREGTLANLCRKVGVSHVTVSIYTTKGAFSPAMAARFEKAFGPEFCRADWLQDPMMIEATKGTEVTK